MLLLSASSYIQAKRPMVSSFYSNFLLLFLPLVSLQNVYMCLFLVCEFHRDATRHMLRFMFFIIISFVNFCILALCALCSSSTSISISRPYLFISIIYMIWMQRNWEHARYLSQVSKAWFWLYTMQLATSLQLERYSTWFYVLIALFCFSTFLFVSMYWIFFS